ncbi:hypothetical protein P153DRAFT_366848 [Dothidotthia symphoricarpi CBS 119687]|uniref:Tautomerase cis-CaaD-like domain-containing protein n=1 Tax=Dothidotthia symphoricarpi CBS 119687 TaxID=1392245 RepID=A0A6A6AEC6_9PLEO|nr:uncharacterized protein P153DRAFT_366848 [Dothidotthia symphoricarpi CBS 119687]KAF2129455.1 hypothetical protein P153DRAFT_366848 [Dothidotthia symphoricarpi CBS 119687]
MPHYEVHHTCPLTLAQIDALASALTDLHCLLFSAPSIFVNVTFHRTQHIHKDNNGIFHTTGDTQHIRVGGRNVMTNYIIGHVRPRGPENRHKLDTLVQEIMRIWNEEARPLLEESSSRREIEEANEDKKRVAHGSKERLGRLDDERALHNVFIMEDIVAGAEQGFTLPLAGQDAKWIEENLAEFEQRAAAGDESMKALVSEIKDKRSKEAAGKSKL